MHWIRSFALFSIIVCFLFCVDGIENREFREHKKMPTTKVTKINTSKKTKTSTTINKRTHTTSTRPSGLL